VQNARHAGRRRDDREHEPVAVCGRVMPHQQIDAARVNERNRAPVKDHIPRTRLHVEPAPHRAPAPSRDRDRRAGPSGPSRRGTESARATRGHENRPPTRSTRPWRNSSTSHRRPCEQRLLTHAARRAGPTHLASRRERARARQGAHRRGLSSSQSVGHRLRVGWSRARHERLPRGAVCDAGRCNERPPGGMSSERRRGAVALPAG